MQVVVFVAWAFGLGLRQNGRAMLTEAEFANWFVGALESAARRAIEQASVVAWHVVSDTTVYDPSELDQIPPNRRFGVWVECELNSVPFAFFWDGLEESVSSFANGRIEKLVEIHSSKFWATEEFKDRVLATVNAVLEETLGRSTDSCL